MSHTQAYLYFIFVHFTAFCILYLYLFIYYLSVLTLRFFFEESFRSSHTVKLFDNFELSLFELFKLLWSLYLMTPVEQHHQPWEHILKTCDLQLSDNWLGPSSGFSSSGVDVWTFSSFTRGDLRSGAVLYLCPLPVPLLDWPLSPLVLSVAQRMNLSCTSDWISWECPLQVQLPLYMHQAQSKTEHKTYHHQELSLHHSGMIVFFVVLK